MPHEMKFFTEQELRENQPAGGRPAGPGRSPEEPKVKWPGEQPRRVKPVLVLGIALLAVLAALAVLILVKGRGKGSQSIPAAGPVSFHQPASAPVEPAPQPQPEPTPEPTPEGPAVSADDWFALLVGMEHPLPEGYDPETDSVDPVGYYFDSRASGELLNMLQAASDAGAQLKITSGFRSRVRQQELHDNEVAYWRGQGLAQEEAYTTAVRYEQPAGYSEHNSGLAVDLVALNNQRENDFAGTPEYQWLVEHAAEFGFIQRYPDGKQDVTGMEPKPWHWRYVGTELAQFLNEQGLTLDEYHSLYLA